MKYEVLWTPSALDEVAELWANADAAMRKAITAATAKIDSLLRNSPDEVGESRPSNQRIAFVPPLGVRFQMRSDQNVVVLRVWAPRRKQ